MIFITSGRRNTSSNFMFEGYLSIIKKSTSISSVVYAGAFIPMQALRSTSLRLIEEAESFHMIMLALVFLNIVRTMSSLISYGAL